MSKKEVKCRDCGFLARLKMPPDSLYSTRADSETLAQDLAKDLRAFQEIGILGISQCDVHQREEITKGTYKDPSDLICIRFVSEYRNLRGKPADAIFQFLNSGRKCAYFFPYNPGYPPIQHMELQREDKTHKLLTRNMLWAAAIGAGATIVGVLIAYLLNKLYG